MYAGHYNTKTCFGENIEDFKMINESAELFIDSAEKNYDVAFCNIDVKNSDRVIKTREVEAKKFLLHAKMQRCLVLKEIYKKYKVDLHDDDEAFAFLFFLMAIREYEFRKIAAKRHIYYLEQKAKRALYKIQCIKELTIDAPDDSLNMNDTSFYSAIPADKIKKIKRIVSIADVEFKQFEQVFSDSKFYMHKRTKKLWLLVEDNLIPLQSTDYIKGE